jgi:VWFA-related protein
VRETCGFILLLTLFSAALAQEPEPAPLRVTVNLVQVDAVVTDKRGHQVTDLTAADFEILQDGKPQKVSHSTYIPTGPAPASASAARPRLPNPATGPLPSPAARPDRQQVRRTVAVVVDDLGLSFTSVAEVRMALRKFIDEQVQPEDMVAIIRTAGDVGALQQFTSDKRRLHAAVDRLRWHWRSRVGLDTFSPSFDSPFSMDERVKTLSIVDSLQKVATVIGAMRDMPGQKSVILFGESLALPVDVPHYADLLDGLYQRVVDLSARASVAIYSIDARGLPTLALTAKDVVRERNPGGVLDPSLMTAMRVAAYHKSQAGMRHLSEATGGKFLADVSNDLSLVAASVMNGLEGYYSLAYVPADSTFTSSAQRKLHKIQVRVKRSGVTVRSRTGFFGDEDREKTPPSPGSAAEMVASMLSPFSGGDIAVEAASLFLDAAEKGPGITTMVHVDPAGLTFQLQPDGSRAARGDIAVLVFGDNGTIAAQTAVTFNPTLSAADYERTLATGLDYVVNVPLGQAGSYDVRVAVRDKSTGKLGTASQFVQVPVLKPEILALSGILLHAADDSPDALRLFHSGQNLTYDCQILNPKLERATRSPKVEALVTLYRDGKELSPGEPAPVAAAAQRLSTGGTIEIGPTYPPGDYVLQLTVTDIAAGRKTATQWIDFRVAP